MAREPGLGGPYFGQGPVARSDQRTSELKMETAAPGAEGPGTLPSRSRRKILFSGNIFRCCGVWFFFSNLNILCNQINKTKTQAQNCLQSNWAAGSVSVRLVADSPLSPRGRASRCCRVCDADPGKTPQRPQTPEPAGPALEPWPSRSSKAAQLTASPASRDPAIAVAGTQHFQP